ncbi:MAG: histidine--tRNA ligase [Rhodobiaceae bacterium]|nr:histidine--tRNA ligase [Rhodobiaceae bacterium]MCC0040636.1 histidine--tRNA ligase [Rhodobiaceae bacterium]
MSGARKQRRVAARLPRGFVDRSAGDLMVSRAMLDKVREVFERYGFDPVETPAIEYTEALGKFLPDQDRPNEGVFSFQDDDEQWLSLRYDLTAPLARYVAENYEALPKPYRSYRQGYVFRNEKPGPGRFRQFMQFDADTVGAASVAADAEICMMMADTMEALGIPRGDYVVRVNNRKVLDGVMEAIGLGGDEHAGRRLTVLRAIDKLDRLGIEGVRALLGEGRKDESGDFTKGAGLDDVQIGRLEKLYAVKADDRADYFLFMKADLVLNDDAIVDTQPSNDQKIGSYVWGNPRILDVILDEFSENKLVQAGVEELQTISDLARAAGYGTKRLRLSPFIVRGLEYYTGPVFETELTFETVNEKGETARYGSVAGGGRYDGLVARFMGQPVPATGFSLGVSRLQAALAALGKLDDAKSVGPVVVTVMDRDQVAGYQAMVAELRNAGIRAELFLGNPKQFGKQLDYADRRGSPCVVIQGSAERDNGVVLIKDLIKGAEIAQAVTDHEAYKEASLAAQIGVAREDLVAEVKAVLARHATAQERS